MDTLLTFVLCCSSPFIQRLIVRFCPQKWLVCVCRRAESQKERYVAPCVLRLSSHIVVQSGIGVSPSRGAMQEYARKHVDPKFVRIPRVHRFLTDFSRGLSLPEGYLFMDYIPGKTLAELDAATVNNAVSKALTKRIARIAVHLQETKAEGEVPPGPVDGGMPFGYLWGEEGTKEVFHSASDMNSWFNKRLKLINKFIDLRPCYPLVLCHGDLVRRNIIVVDSDKDDTTEGYENSQLALVDWGHAALLPRVCEIASMSCYMDRGGHSYTRELQQATIEAIGGLTVAEEECRKLLMSARGLSLRYKRL